MIETLESPGTRQILGGSALVALAGVLGGVLGYGIPRATGLEEVTVAAITFELSPTMGALYGVVAVGTFLITIVGVLLALSSLEEESLEPR